MGGCGLRDALRTSKLAFWDSWADCLSVDVVIDLLNWGAVFPTLRAAGAAARELAGVEGFEVPTWEALAHGLRPPTRQFEDPTRGSIARGIGFQGESDVAALRTRPSSDGIAGRWQGSCCLLLRPAR